MPGKDKHGHFVGRWLPENSGHIKWVIYHHGMRVPRVLREQTDPEYSEQAVADSGRASVFKTLMVKTKNPHRGIQGKFTINPGCN